MASCHREGRSVLFPREAASWSRPCREAPFKCLVAGLEFARRRLAYFADTRTASSPTELAPKSVQASAATSESLPSSVEILRGPAVWCGVQAMEQQQQQQQSVQFKAPPQRQQRISRWTQRQRNKERASQLSPLTAVLSPVPPMVLRDGSLLTMCVVCL